jgi:hypothetical protein
MPRQRDGLAVLSSGIASVWCRTVREWDAGARRLKISQDSGLILVNHDDAHKRPRHCWDVLMIPPMLHPREMVELLIAAHGLDGALY